MNAKNQHETKICETGQGLMKKARTVARQTSKGGFTFVQKGLRF